MYETLLQQLGLTDDQITIYETLLKTGAIKVSKLVQQTPFKRVLVYKLLNDLTALGLVEKDERSEKVTLFKPAHPVSLQQLVEEREKQIKTIKKVLDHTLPALVSDFNLISGKPNVRFFEGKEGIIKVYEELLNERAPIDSIEDKGEMAEFIADYFPAFIKKRVERGIFNRVINPTGNPINKTDDKELRETRSIDVKKYPLSMDIKIVKNKVALVTFKKDSAIGVLIDHPEIAENFRLIFEYMWNSLH